MSEFLKQDTEGQLNETISWYKWKLITLETENGVTKKVTYCVKQETTLEDCVKELENDVIKYPGHIFRASWQHSQMQSSIANLKTGEVVMLMDFSENYRCRFQNESQNAYFEQRQVNIHPFMCYYINENKLVKQSITVVSDDTKHDSHAVEVFENKAIELLNNQEVEVDSIHKFSDGAAVQYKGKTSFLQLSNSKIPVVRNYFETSHGKSPCDGLGAVIKNTCWNAVKSGIAVLGSAKDVFSYCKKLEHGHKLVGKGNQEYISKRNVIYVDSKDIKRETIMVKTLVGTRLLHSVRSTGKPREVEIRNLTCYCLHCRDDMETSCMNKSYIDPWMLKKLAITGAQAEEVDQTTATNDLNHEGYPNDEPPANPIIVMQRSDCILSLAYSGMKLVLP